MRKWWHLIGRILSRRAGRPDSDISEKLEKVFEDLERDSDRLLELEISLAPSLK